MPYDELRLGKLPGYWKLPVDVESMTLLTSSLLGSGRLYCGTTAGAGVLNCGARLLGSTHLQFAEHGGKFHVAYVSSSTFAFFLLRAGDLIF